MIQLFNNLISVLPILLLIITVMVIFCLISFKPHNGFIIHLVTLLGLFLSIFSVFIKYNNEAQWYSELFIIDKYSKFSMILFLLSSVYTCLLSYSWIKLKNYNAIELYVFLLLSTVGGLIVSVATHMSTLFIGIELLFLPGLGLVGYERSINKTIFFTLKYMILSIFSSLIMLLGFLIIYSTTGQLSFIHLANMFLYYPAIMFNQRIVLGLLIVFVAFFFKISLFPMHLWVPEIYSCMNSFTLIYFSTAIKIAIFTFLFRFFLYIPALYYSNIIYILLLTVSLSSIMFGNCMAFFQKNINRLIAYSSLTHAGYLLLILLISLNREGKIFREEGFYIFFIGYILSMICFFSIKSYIEYNFLYKNHITCNNCLEGLYGKNTIICFFMTFLFLSFAGVPFTIGFWGKFYILRFLLQKKIWWIVLVIIFSNIIGMQCYLSVIASLYKTKCNTFHTKNKFNKKIIFFMDIEYFFILLLSIILVIFSFFPHKLIHIINVF